MEGNSTNTKVYTCPLSF